MLILFFPPWVPWIQDLLLEADCSRLQPNPLCNWMTSNILVFSVYRSLKQGKLQWICMVNATRLWNNRWKLFFKCYLWWREGLALWGKPMMALLQGGGCPPGPLRGLLCNTGKWVIWGDAHADKTRGFLGKGHRMESRRAREPSSATRLSVSRLMVRGLFPGCFWPVVLAQGPSWRHTHCSAKMDSSKEDSGRGVGHTDCCFLLTFPKLFWLVVACQFLAPDQASRHKIPVK